MNAYITAVSASLPTAATVPQFIAANSAANGHGGSVTPFLQWLGWFVVGIAILTTIVVYVRQYAGFRTKYSELKERLKDSDSAKERSGTPAGEAFVLASRGPTHSLEAELRSAEVRYSQLSVAFPDVTAVSIRRSPNSPRPPLMLVSVPYTGIEQIGEMQRDVAQRVTLQFHRDFAITDPIWTEDERRQFDALRHPELAIATPAFYTFPFFLSWQRRHQWGVLPYATHTRLGLLVRGDHPNISELASIEKEYEDTAAIVKQERYARWINDPHFGRWLEIIVKAGSETPIPIDNVPRDVSLLQLHQCARVFSVGAYLHREILPLMCAVRGDSLTAARLATTVQELDATDLASIDGAPSNAFASWHQASALIVDLAKSPDVDPESGMRLLKVPHCVYIPIGIGYSIVTVQILLSNLPWASNLLKEAGDILSMKNGANELQKVGIELDERLWNSSAILKR
jgi:hypothetical protein